MYFQTCGFSCLIISFEVEVINKLKDAGIFSRNDSLHYFIQALAWCPWQTNVLASGGGTADRHIRLWNCNNGARLNAIDTKSQVRKFINILISSVIYLSTKT